MSVAFVLGGGGRWGAVEPTRSGIARLDQAWRDQFRNLVRLAPDHRRQLEWSDCTDSDELIGGVRAATTDDLASIS